MASSVLAPWSNFYVMAGSSAAGLTGLMFVVISLVTGRDRRQTKRGISTFSTPTVLHFGAALLTSAILCAPWHSLVGAATLVGLIGLCGIAYVLRVMHETRRLSTYSPDLEDWICYTVLPLLAYGEILGGAIALPVVPVNALFAVAGGVVLLMFIGIRNAWDIVTFVATGALDDQLTSSGDDEPSAPP